MFRRRVTVLLDDDPPPDGRRRRSTMRTAESDRARCASPSSTGSGSRPVLSEDARCSCESLGGVFGFMLENVRLQRKRLEQEQVAQRAAPADAAARSSRRCARRSIRISCSTRSTRSRRSSTPIRRAPTRPSSNSPRCSATRCADPIRNGRRSIRSWPLRAPISTSSRRGSESVSNTRIDRRSDSGARAQVPAMLLQTLVENAVKHGISQVARPGRIDITRRARRRRLPSRSATPVLGRTRRSSPAAAARASACAACAIACTATSAAHASLDLLARGRPHHRPRSSLPLIEQTSPLAGIAR